MKNLLISLFVGLFGFGIANASELELNTYPLSSCDNEGVPSYSCSLDTDGGVSYTGTQTRTTDFIYIDDDFSIVLTVPSSYASNRKIAFYDSSFTFISYSNYNTQNATTDITIPEGTNYIKVTFILTSDNRITIVSGDGVSEISGFTGVINTLTDLISQVLVIITTNLILLIALGVFVIGVCIAYIRRLR